jgi:putative DNA-invertase from lambdoid prophage Rac
VAHVAYFRVSTIDQSVEAQRRALLKHSTGFDKEFVDEGVGGAVLAADRPAFSALLTYLREGDTLHVYAVDRLGRDAIDVQKTVRELLQRGVAIDVHQLGLISLGAGELILAVLAQVADMERARIRERTAAGREVAKKSLAASGKTHRGKTSMGRPLGRVAGSRLIDPREVAAWRAAHNASIASTATHFDLSPASVKRYCSRSER